jgi:flagella basal body P-ring formation protein FlgA
LIKSLQKGATLKTNHLKPDWLVYKNQKIIIEHKIGEIYVKMDAIALSNGAKGDRVLAKNISSNKTVEGFVKSEKKISIFRKIY